MTQGGHPPSGARRPAKGRLALRMAAGLGLGAAVVLVAGGWWGLSVQRRQMTDLVQLGAEHAALIARSATRDAMSRNDPEAVQRILEAVGAQRGIERIRILDKQGRIVRSTDPSETGRTVDRRAEQCTVCHAADRPLEKPERADRMRVFEKAPGERVLAVVEPIPNEPDCSSAACHAHAPGRRVLGLLDVQLSLGAMDRRMAASQRLTAAGLGTAVLSTLALSALLLWRFVLRPVRRLEQAMDVAAAGDLTVRAPVTSTDEIGALTASWNDLVGELGRARSELETWNRTLESRVAQATGALERAHRNMAFVERMASLGKLAAVVAHELNNPLAGIATYAKLLRRRLGAAPGPEPRDTEVARALELVETEAVRCGGIVRNLLTFSRTTGSRFAEEDLRPYLERCVMLLRHPADLQGVAISLDVAPDLPKVVCDGAQVQQAVLALATNGIEAMPRGGRLSIAARHDPAAEEAVLEVADDGCGIDAKDLPHVFEPFFTTKEQGKGVGLGLAVVYGIATRHHGRVEVASRPGEGTRFTVSLPLRPPPEPAAVPQGATP